MKACTPAVYAYSARQSGCTGSDVLFDGLFAVSDIEPPSFSSVTTDYGWKFIWPAPVRS